MKESATIKVINLRSPKVIQAGLKLSIISLGPPSTCCPTRHEDFYQAARVRLLRAVPAEIPASWPSLNPWVSGSATLARLITPKWHLTEARINAWVATQPPAMQRRYQAAIASLDADPLHAGDCRATGFLKVEKAALLDLTGKVYANPRIISAYSDRRQVTTGPIHKLMARDWRAKFAPTPGNAAVWVNGKAATADAFGAWCDAAILSCGADGYEVVWGDQEKFEAHRCGPAWSGFQDLCKNACSDPRFLKAMRETKKLSVKGLNHNWAFVVDNVLGSGVTETSLDSAFRNISGQVYVFGEPTWGRIMIAFNGDDFLAIIRKGLVPSKATFQSRMVELGFECSYDRSDNLWDAEFCQMLPYPTTEGTVWGPKIGRVLTRLPWQTTASRDDPKGVALGMMTSCHHVPFLKEYLDRVLELCAGMRVKVVNYEHRATTTRRFHPSPETWAFLEHKYKLTCDALTSFTKHLAGCQLRQTLVWDDLARLASIDA